MAQKCKDCGAILSSYNLGLLCWPCQEKKKEQLQEKIGDTPHYTVENLCFLLGYANPESVKRLGRKGKIPGRIPGIRQHLYLKEKVDQWVHGEQQEAPTAEVIVQKPYEDTPHKQKMRELARELARIRLPSISDSFRWLFVESSEYSELCNDSFFSVLHLGGLEIAAFADMKYMRNPNSDFDEADYEWQALFGHLKTGGLTEVVNKIEYFDSKSEQYYKQCHNLMKIVKKRIRDDTHFSIPCREEGKPGFTPLFPVLICEDAIQTYNGSGYIDDSWYKIELLGNQWVLSCSRSAIYVDESEEELIRYEDLHKYLRLKWEDNNKTESIKNIVDLRKDLEIVTRKVKKDLLTFAGKERLPGHCELCS